MKENRISVYENLAKSKISQFSDLVQFSLSFDYGPKIELSGNKVRNNYSVKFKVDEEDNYNYQGEISPGVFTKLFRRWYSNWTVEIYRNEELIESLSLVDKIREKKVCISLDSNSLGDNLAWLPIIEEFRKKYELDLYASGNTYGIFNLFYPNIRFNGFGYREPNTEAVIGVGWYEESNPHHHKRDPRTISLQQVASDHLGIKSEKEILPQHIPYQVTSSKSNFSGKYVCIATESTADAKHWHYPGGWQTIIDYLNDEGYKVVLIQQQKSNLQNVIDKTGNSNLLEVAIDIYHSDFFIGISSGLSWLAWTLQKPVIMISGFSSEICEFTNKNYRVINKDVCHGCFSNTKYKFDKGDWNWCPVNKGTEKMFECTKNITPDMIKSTISILREEQMIISDSHFPFLDI